MLSITIRTAENGYVVAVSRNGEERGVWVAGNSEAVDEIVHRVLPTDFPEPPEYVSPQLPENE